MGAQRHSDLMDALHSKNSKQARWNLHEGKKCVYNHAPESQQKMTSPLILASWGKATRCQIQMSGGAQC